MRKKENVEDAREKICLFACEGEREREREREREEETQRDGEVSRLRMSSAFSHL